MLVEINLSPLFALKNWFSKQAENSKDLFNSVVNKFDELKGKVGGSGGSNYVHLVDNIISDPASIANKSADEIAEMFRSAGYNVVKKPLLSGRGEQILVEGHKVNSIKVYDGSGRHGVARTEISGNEVRVKIIKGSVDDYIGNIQEEIDAGKTFIFLEN